MQSTSVTLNATPVKRRIPSRKRLSQRAAARSQESAIAKGRGWPAWIGAGAVVLLLLAVMIVWSQSGLFRRKPAPTQGYSLVRTYPHDPDAYCQGLVYQDGFLYEGTGKRGESTLRKVELETGKVVQQHKLDERLFGEGITIWNDQIIQLTWTSRQAIVYDLATFREKRRFSYQGEGWGLTHNGHSLIMSDGTATLRFLDPRTFEVQRLLVVRDGSRRVDKLNELEYVEGEIYANVWYDDRIARISPRTGQVIGWLDLSGIYPQSQRPNEDAVLNGIAYDQKQHRLFVTGKDWPHLYEIRLPH
jgi:glutamine cyclotransferase